MTEEAEASEAPEQSASRSKESAEVGKALDSLADGVRACVALGDPQPLKTVDASVSDTYARTRQHVGVHTIAPHATLNQD